LKKIVFPIKNINFVQLAATAKKYKLDDFDLINQAFDQNVLNKEDNIELLKKFILSFKDKKNIQSQLYQDIFASFIVGDKFDKTFLEFGATDGFEYSNSYMLENLLSWNGVLSEPSPQWHDSLKKNRIKSKIITKCIWTKSDEKLDFFVSDVGVLSTIKDFIESDKSSVPANTKKRVEKGKIVSVETISLNDVVINYFNGKAPSYISIDTEGSEYEILKSFRFDHYRPKVFTIEHNFTNDQIKIDDLMMSNNYVRLFKNLTEFDGWYVCKDAL
tara:strand:+ start:2364 stop:3182 length:819 start_codon:yes stop_codon:yes gene_type:complete